MTEPVRIRATLVVRSVADVAGRNGPQWEIQADVPDLGSQYPQKFWLDASPQAIRPTPGQSYLAALQRATMQTKKDGTSYDGSKPWMFRWTIAGLQPLPPASPPGTPWPPAPAPQASQVPPSPSGANVGAVDPYQAREMAKQSSIHRQVALKAAVELATTYLDAAEYGEAMLRVIETAQTFAALLETWGQVPDLPDAPIDNEAPPF